MSPTLEDLQEAFAGLLGPVPAAAPVVLEPAPGVGEAPIAALAAAPVPAPAPSPIQLVDAKVHGYHLDVTVAPDQVVMVADLIDAKGFAIDAVTGVDWMVAGQMEVVYDFYHFHSPLHVVVRTRVPREKPELPTISGVFPGANWHERETHEFFGIKFLGHPKLIPLLLPEDAEYHPLRKDFTGAA